MAFGVDMMTPQALNAEVFYSVPVVLAAFSPSRRLTYRLILVAILADELGAIGDAAIDGFHWDVIGIENRFLSLVTLATPGVSGALLNQSYGDIGETGDIHPHNKQDVGKRLAQWALAKTYGKDVVASGPLYESMQKQDDKIVLHFA